jgi:hypothetical protein
MRVQLAMAKKSRSRAAGGKLNALLSAALAIPGIALTERVAAEPAADAPVVRIRYADYRDYQTGREGRMRIKAPMASISMPLGERNLLETSFTYDSMSGASPYYLSSLSGASGTGIHDNRRAGDLKLTHSFDRFSVAAGGSISDEDDYLSRGGSVESKIWTADKNTTFTLGFSYDKDDVSSSLNEELGARKRVQNYLFGITQVLTPDSIVQSNINYAHANGYNSDPYKTLDNRPRNRDSWSWLNRYNLYFPELEASLHADYRFFIDSWGIKSHTMEVAWYQPLGTAWMLRPSIRYYSQSAAQFYEDVFPPDDFERQYSADQRMGNFGSIGAGLKLIRDLGKGFSADISFQAFMQKPEYKLGGSSRSEVEDFYATFLSFGVAKKF